MIQNERDELHPRNHLKTEKRLQTLALFTDLF